MGQFAMLLRDESVWAVVGQDGEIRSVGTSATDAWRDFFDRAGVWDPTLDEMAEILGNATFRCISCRLIPDDDDHLGRAVAAAAAGDGWMDG